MQTALTKEEYLTNRANGKTRGAIALEHGMTRGQLMYQLRKWGVDDSTTESDMVNTGTQALSENDALSFEWVLPETVESMVRLTLHGIRITGNITNHLNAHKPVVVGFAKGVIAIRNVETGWPLTIQRNAKDSFFIPGKKISNVTFQHGFKSGDKCKAEWDESRQMIIARME